MALRSTPWNGISQTLRQLSARFPIRDDSAEEAQLYYRRACLAAPEERYDVALVFAGKALALEPRHLPTRLLVAQIHDRGLHDVEAAIRATRRSSRSPATRARIRTAPRPETALDLLVSRATRIPIEEPAEAGSR